jgi:hypothetical protein
MGIVAVGYLPTLHDMLQPSRGTLLLKDTTIACRKLMIRTRTSNAPKQLQFIQVYSAAPAVADYCCLAAFAAAPGRRRVLRLHLHPAAVLLCTSLGPAGDTIHFKGHMTAACGCIWAPIAGLVAVTKDAAASPKRVLHCN